MASVSIKRMTISVEIFLKNALFNDSKKFADILAKHGFSPSYGTPDQPVMVRDRFTVRTARTPRVRDRAMNLAAISISSNDLEGFVNHIMSVKEIVKDLQIDLDSETRNCSVLTNAWVGTQNDPAQILNNLKDVSGIASLKGFVCHRTPFEKLECVYESQELDGEWHRVDVDYTENREYLVSMHHHGKSLADMINYLRRSAERISSIVNDIERKYN
jgi:hypothetical protein